MKYLGVFFFAVGVALLSGCATPAYNYRADSIEISEPPIDKIAVAYVGDSLVRQGQRTEQQTIYLNENTGIGLLNAYTIVRGYYAKEGDDGITEFYLPSRQDGGQILKSLLADPPKIIQAYKSESKLCVITIFNVPICKTVDFERRKQAVQSSDSFQQTLIYSGRIGGKIRIGYREFSGDAARPAFNNEAEYDLNDSKVIGYKGAKLEVIEATNEFIKYRVLRNFNNVKP